MAKNELNIVFRLLWFYCLGLWLGALWLLGAWICCVTIIGLPLGMWMVERAPAIMTLKDEDRYGTIQIGDKTAYYLKKAEDVPIVFRFLWFILIGWWLGLVWIKLSFFAAFTFIGIPLSFWMINRLPFVMTLKES